LEFRFAFAARFLMVCSHLPPPDPRIGWQALQQQLHQTAQEREQEHNSELRRLQARIALLEKDQATTAREATATTNTTAREALVLAAKEDARAAMRSPHALLLEEVRAGHLLPYMDV